MKHAWYLPAAVSGWRARSSGIIAAIAAVSAISACGGGQRQDVAEPVGKFPVSVTQARFPLSQRLSEHTHMVIVVRNTGRRAIPDLAVTICNISCSATQQTGAGTGSSAFSEISHQPDLANPSRPIWIVDRPPGRCGYSCQSGGPGAAVTAYANTWAVGRLQPGATATFDWGVTAIKPGRHVVSYQVAAGLNGKARAVLQNGASPTGKFRVTITDQPQASYVGAGGQIITGR